jgi:LEA14-like dessication related protein
MVRNIAIVILLFTTTFSCKTPKEDVVLRRIKDVVVDASDEPMLKANAILYNPNNVKMKLRKIDIEVFVDGKPSAIIDQTLNMIIPANSEFTVPLEVKLNLKKMGFLDTVFGVIGGKKFKIRYKGNIKITYKALPLRVPVDYEDEVRIRL